MGDKLPDLSGSDPLSTAAAVIPCQPFFGLDPDLAVKCFFQDPEWIHKTAIGGVMNATAMVLLFLIHESPILIPLMFSFWAINTGYVLRTIRQRISVPNGRLPVWNDWQDLFVSGMSWLAVTTGFLIFLVTLTATDLLVASVLSYFKTHTYLFTIWMSGSIILVVTFSFLFNLLLAATMANFAQEESMNSAFAFFKVFKRIFIRPGDFFSAWMLGMGIQFLSVAIPCATVVGIFFLPTTIFAGQLISASLIAQAWKSSCQTAEEEQLKKIELAKDEPKKKKK